MKNLLQIILLLPALALADDMDVLIGDWSSSDGMLKHRIERAFDGSLLETKMWFKVEGEWKLVSQGTGYRRPGDNAWRFVSRTTDMRGIELFESIVERTSEMTYRVANIAYQEDGSSSETEEEWSFVNKDHYSYTIYQTKDGERTPWYTGEWFRKVGGGEH
jgi:hypothetical protein